MRDPKPATTTTEPLDLPAATATSDGAHPPSQSPFGPAGSGPSRRNLLRAAGLVALVGGGGATLAACSSGETGSAPAPSTTPSSVTPSSPAASSSAPSASASSPAAPASSSAAVPDGPSVTSADVPVGGGVILQDADYVVTQPEKGSFKAFSKICTHQGCAVAQIVDKEIVCNCHGSHFSISDGSVLSGPADEPLPEAKTTVAGGQVVVTV